MRFLHQSDDVGESRILAYLAGFDFKAAGFVNSGTDNTVAGLLFYRHTLSGNHGLVNAGVTCLNHAIYGHPLAGTYQDEVTDLNLFNGNLPLFTFAHNQRRLWLHADELLYRFRSLSSGPRFQKAAKKDQGYDRRRRIEV